MILFITNKEDITTDFLIDKSNKWGLNYYRLNTEDLINKIDISLDFSNQSFILEDHLKNEIIDLSLIKSVYFRRPKLASINNLDLTVGEQAFIKSEISYTLEGLYKILSDRFWISPVHSIREAENKIYQIFLAQNLGFKIPNSLITNNKKNALLFLKQNSKCVIKPIKTGFVDDNKNPRIIFTNLVEKSHVEKSAINTCPVYLQNNIVKKADIRVTIVGRQFFASKIFSQEFKETSIDWRKGENINLKYERIKLPEEIESKCLRLIEILNLNFGALDFILDENNDFIFLEINPNGQWGWIEKRLGYDISGAILNLLMRQRKNVAGAFRE